MVTLDIFSDPICPWCYIGKTYLDRALEQAQDHPFQVRWHPFQLNPEMPRQGMDRAEYLEAKFGSKDAVAKAYMPVMEHAEKAGIALNLSAITRTPNTLNAHRLIFWAEIEERQSFVVQRLFEAYFRDGRDISDPEVLADIADGVGMDAALIHRLLASEADIRETVDRDAAARGMGVTSVPTFVVAGKHAVPGAQQPDLWAKVIEEIKGQL